ncbi:MAG TPA: hypothetical protein VIJ92_01830 [Ginsengibacter sp.]
MDKTYKYIGYFMLLLIPLIFAGFYKSYFQSFPFAENIHVFEHLHAFIASVWVLMLIVQPFLILNKKNALHRKVGKLSYIVFPLLIVSFIPQIIKIIHSQDIVNLFFPLSDGILLIAFYSLAIYNRNQRSKHMRYMIASALVLLGPTVGRIGPTLLGWSGNFTQNVQYAIIYTILISLILYDKKNHRKFQPYLVATGGFIIHQVVFYTLFL